MSEGGSASIALFSFFLFVLDPSMNYSDERGKKGK